MPEPAHVPDVSDRLDEIERTLALTVLTTRAISYTQGLDLDTDHDRTAMSRCAELLFAALQDVQSVRQALTSDALALDAPAVKVQ